MTTDMVPGGRPELWPVSDFALSRTFSFTAAATTASNSPVPDQNACPTGTSTHQNTNNVSPRTVVEERGAAKSTCTMGIIHSPEASRVDT